MSTIALVTMIGAWIVIATFMIRFFLLVLRKPQEKG